MITAFFIAVVLRVFTSVIDIVISVLFVFVGRIPFTGGGIDVVSIASLIQQASVFFPIDMIFMIIGSVVNWYVIRLCWAVFLFVLKFIPFIGD